MEQIYYTQCPVGYGLGASNGFQVKRLSRGYPMSGDFRHLGLKAFPGGGRTLAPPALRYRRDGDVAEVAWLTPRANEYETERGLWGRPGGHFAHGLRLAPDELKAIKRWPAGLFEGPAWVRTDREPSRGRPPDEFELSTDSLSPPPTFADVSQIAGGQDPDRLARLLTALAMVTREGRTLFLIDQPERLGPLVALLTFGFPEKLREDLTFSTYHDRPEELPGFRISGTTHLARPNKTALTAQGVVADLASGKFEPSIEPKSWALTLSGWLTRRDAVDEADWSATDSRARAARKPEGPDSPWSDEWLEALHAYPAALRSRKAPADEGAWASLGGFARWLGRTGLAGDWARVRGPDWWLDQAESAREGAEARAAMVAQAILPESWKGEARAAGWGRAVASWFRDVEPADRDRSIAVILRSAPKSARPSFAGALLQGLGPEGVDAVLILLQEELKDDPAVLLPLEAGAAVTAILGGADPDPLGMIVERALSLDGATSAVLDAIEGGIAGSPEALASFASAASAAFDPDGPKEGREGIAWALRRGPLAPGWLGPAFRPILADPGRQSTWPGLLHRTPDDLKANLARTVLAIASDEGLPDEAFRWGVEGLLLPLAPRPSDPTWAETYLRRTPDGMKLLKRLVGGEYVKLGVPDWIKQARARGEVSTEQAGRVDVHLTYFQTLKSGDPTSLLNVELPEVPTRERGMLLSQMLEKLGGSSADGLPFVLGAARQAWPGAFEPASEGLRGLAEPLARCLLASKLSNSALLARLTRMIEWLGVALGPARGFEPDGLAAEVVASFSRASGGSTDLGPLRRLLFEDDSAWRILALNIRRDLEAATPEAAPEILSRWINDLPSNSKSPGRIYELLLNAPEGSSLAYAIAGLLPELATHPRHPWWDHRRFEDAPDDLREGFVRVVPIAPLPIGGSPSNDLVRPARGVDGKSMSLLVGWIEGKAPRRGEADPNALISVDDLPGEAPFSGMAGASTPPHISPRGLARWRCLKALTDFKNASPSGRWPVIVGWEKDLPLGLLPVDDRYRFASWLILGLGDPEAIPTARMAAWFARSGVRDPDRLSRWAEEIEGLVEIPGETKLGRASLNKELRIELTRLLLEARESKAGRS